MEKVCVEGLKREQDDPNMHLECGMMQRMRETWKGALVTQKKDNT